MSAGNLIWADSLGATDQSSNSTKAANVRGIVIVDDGGTERLFVGIDSQTSTGNIQSPGIFEFNPSSGAVVAGVEYVHAGTQHEVRDFKAGDGTLLLLAEDVLLTINMSDLSISQQWQSGADPAITFTTVDISGFQGGTSSPDFLGSQANPTAAEMPFFTGSPLANTQAPTDAANYTFPAELSATTNVTAALVSSATPWIDPNDMEDAENIVFRSVVETSEGIYVHFTEDINGASQQGVAKLNKINNFTTEWGRYWAQGAERGAIVADENNNVYVYSWDQAYFLHGGGLDALGNKFDKDGNIVWSKAYGSGVSNELNWSAAAIAIDQSNQEIALALYTDSYPVAPSSLLLSTNYDGNIQNYTFLSVSGESRIPLAMSLDGNKNAYVAYYDDNDGPGGVFKVNTTTVFLAPVLVSATKDSDTQITVTFSENVQTNEGNATDFTVTDGSGSTFAVSSQVDDTAGDTEIVLTVASLSTALGDLTVTYNNANNEISDEATGTKFTATDATGVVIDLDADAPTLSSGAKDSDTQLTITFSEAVQTNEMNPTDFIVMDASPTAFAVSAQADGTAKDTDIILTVANLSGATLPLTVTYTNANGEISDFGGNELATDATGIDIQQLIIWDGETSSDWGTATNWVGDVLPISSNAIEIPDVANDPIITSDVEVNSIDIQTGAVLTVTSNSLKVNNATTLDGSMTVASGASFVPLGSISGAGSATINRSTTFGSSAGRYSVIGSPITMGSTSSLGSIIYSYDETVAYDPGGTDGSARFIAVATPETMAVGDAYFSANTENITFTGTPNSGNIDVSLVYDETNDGGTSTNAGFNLVSNPYTAAISYTNFAAGNADIDGTIYLWDDGDSNSGQRTNSDYLTANSIGAASGGSNRSASWDGYIRSTQGFIVKATSAGTLNFTPSMMDVGNNSDAGYFREVETKPLRLSLSSSEWYSDILIGFSEEATMQYDRTLDAYKRKGNRDLQLYSRMEESIMAIQALPMLTEALTIPLGFDVSKQGEYTLALSDFDINGYILFLLDHELDQVVDLSDENSYSFTASTVENSSRFSLVFSTSQILSIDNNFKTDQLIVFSNNNQLTIRTEQELSDATVKIYDLSGSMVGQFDQVNFDGSGWSTSFNKEGLFIATVQAQGKLLVKKFFK